MDRENANDTPANPLIPAATDVQPQTTIRSQAAGGFLPCDIDPDQIPTETITRGGRRIFLDEAGVLRESHPEHRSDYELIEKISEEILRPVYGYLRKRGEDFKIMVLPDHPTPLEIRTHSSEPVPYFIYDSRREQDGVQRFTEENCAAVNNYLPNGYELLGRMIEKK